MSIFVAGAKTTKNGLTDERRGSYAGSQRRRSFMTLRVFTVPRLRRKFSGQMVRACFCIGGKCLGELYYCRRDYNAFSQRDGICRGYPVVLIRRRPRPITPRAFFCPPRFFRKCSGTRRFVILMLGSFALSESKIVNQEGRPRLTRISRAKVNRRVVARVLSIQRVHPWC